MTRPITLASGLIGIRGLTDEGGHKPEVEAVRAQGDYDIMEKMDMYISNACPFGVAAGH